MKPIKKCIDCNKELSKYSKYLEVKRCKSCHAIKQHKNNNFGISPKGKNHWNWKGGKYTSEGYCRILKSNHPYANKQGYVTEHRLTMEKHLGRYLTAKEIVHHINGIRNDNRIENLFLATRHTHPIDRFKWKNILQKRIIQLELQLKKGTK